MPRWLPWAATAITGVVLAFGVWALLQITPWASHAQSAAAAVPAPAKQIERAAPPSVPAATLASAPTPVPTVAAAPAAPAATPLADLLDRYKAETDPDDAFAQLFKLWKAVYVAGDVDPCTQAQQQGLECLMQRGSFGQLRHYNRPAILMLNDPKGGAHQVVVATLSDERAQIDLGGARREVSIAELGALLVRRFRIAAEARRRRRAGPPC